MMHQDTICVALQRIPENILAADFAGNAVISRRTKKKKKKREEEEQRERILPSTAIVSESG